MHKTHRATWGFGLAGLAIGIVLTAIGVFGADEIASMAAGYGLMVIGSAVFLLAGLTVRERIGRRAPAIAARSRSTASISARS